MAKLVFEGSDASGARRTEIVHADGLDAGFDLARSRGLKDPVLLHSNLGVGPLMRAGSTAGSKDALPLRADATRLDRFFYVMRAARRMWPMSAGCLALFAIISFVPFPLKAFFQLLFLSLGMSTPALVLYLTFFKTSLQRMVDEYSAAMFARDYPRVERALDALGRSKLAEFQVTSMRARYLATKGDKDAALRLLASTEKDPAIDRLTQLTHLVMLYGAAGDWAAQIPILEEGLALGANRGQMLINIALAETRLGNIARARELFEQARPLPIPRDVEYARAVLEGALLTEAGAYADAIAVLEGALGAVPKESVPGYAALINAHLALALALSGDKARVHPLFAEAEPYLTGRGHDRLLEACRAALEI